MAALVKLSLASRMGNYLRIKLLDGVTFRPTNSSMGVQLAGGTLTAVGGEKDGEVVEFALKANQKVRWSVGTCCPQKYHAVLEANPDLMALGTVQVQTLLEPNEERSVGLYFTATRACDLATLEWAVRIYLLD